MSNIKLPIPIPVPTVPGVTCVVLGNRRTGKSTLALGCLLEYDEDPSFVDHIIKSYVYEDTKYEMHMADTLFHPDESAQPRPPPLSTHEQTGPTKELMFEVADIFVICFDIIRPSSFRAVEAVWLAEIRARQPSTPVIVVGTRVDLRDHKPTTDSMAALGKKPITQEQGKKLADKIGAAAYVEVSVRKRRGVKEVYDEAIKAHNLFTSGEGFIYQKKKDCIIT